MTEFTGSGLRINPTDLSTISPEGDDDDRMFHHDGSSDISIVGGGSDSERGYYIWDASASAWFPLFRNADKIDGKEAADFLHRDGSLPMEADLDAGNYGVINLGEVSGGTGGVHLNDNHLAVHSHSAGSNIRLLDNNGLLIAEAIEGGDFDTPNGALREQGNRVATRLWTNANADVPNADYADNANQLDGYDETAFLHVSGDQMEGVLDLGANNIEDGTDVLWDALNTEVPQTSLGGPAASLDAYPLLNSDIANSSVTVAAGNQLTGGGTMSLGGSVTVNVDESGLDSDTLDGAHKSDLDSQYVDVTGDTMSGHLTVNGGDGDYVELHGHKITTQDYSTDANGNPDQYGYLEVLNNNGIRGAFFGHGNGGSNIDLQLDNATVLDVSGGELRESGNRVATRMWTNTNFYDTTQADSNFVDVSGDTMSGALDVSSVIEAHGVKNISNINYSFWGDGPGMSARGMSVFQMGDDSALEGESGYATGANFITESGERIASMTADKVHNHWGIYTRGSAFDGTDAQPIKRFNVQGGEPVSGIDFYAVDKLQIGPRTSDNSHSGNMDVIVEGESTGDINLRFDHDDSTAANIMFDSSRDSVRLQNYRATTADFLEFRSTGEIRAHGHDFTGVGSMDLGDNQIANLSLQNVNSMEMDGDIFGSGIDIEVREVSKVLGPKNGDTSLALETQGDGTHRIVLWDGFNSSAMLTANEGGPVNAGANLQEYGNRVATRTWVQNTATANDADTLNSLASSQFLRSDVADTLNAELTVSGETKVNFGGTSYHVRYDSGRDTLLIGSAMNGEVAEIDASGNLAIEGSLTEGATIGA